MQKIKIIRPEHIVDLLKETQAEFAKRDIEITIDQAHSLHDLIHWQSLLSVKEMVDIMLKDYCSIVK